MEPKSHRTRYPLEQLFRWPPRSISHKKKQKLRELINHVGRGYGFITVPILDNELDAFEQRFIVEVSRRMHAVFLDMLQDLQAERRERPPVAMTPPEELFTEEPLTT